MFLRQPQCRERNRAFYESKEVPITKCPLRYAKNNTKNVRGSLRVNIDPPNCGIDLSVYF